MEKRLKVLLKTKGGHKEGMGDITSSLALAEEFRKRGHSAFFIINNNKSAIQLIAQKGFIYKIGETLNEVESCVKKTSIDVSILAQLNTVYEEGLIYKKKSKLLVTVDDTDVTAAIANLCFNALYPIERSFSDFKYIALRDMYREKYSLRGPLRDKVRTILIVRGGSDTYGYTIKVVKALYGIPDNVNVIVVIGSNFSHNKGLAEALNKAPRSFEIVRDKSDLSGLMLQTDIAVSAAGFTLFELACLGVPAVIVCNKPFEVETAERCQKVGMSINLGFGKYVAEQDISVAVKKLIGDNSLRFKMSQICTRLVDGNGAGRIVDKIIETVC